MITKTITAEDGIKRMIEGKIFGDELRIYRVFGDITNRESLKEMAQILAIENKVSKVVYTNI